MATGQEDDYTTGCCLLDYNYFKKCNNMIGIDLSKQQVSDAEPDAIQFYRKSRSRRNYNIFFHY